jgi:hypothetical protein
MAKLIKCKECGKEISKSAKTCPHCGAKIKKRKGLAITILIIGGIIIIGSAIGGSSKSETSSSYNVTVGESIQVNPYEISIVSIKRLTKVGDIFTETAPSEGGIFIGIYYQIKNISNEPQDTSSDFTTVLLDPNNIKYQSDFDADFAYSLDIGEDVKGPLSSQNPGITAKAVYVFEVSKDLLSTGVWKIDIRISDGLFDVDEPKHVYVEVPKE